MNKKPFLLLFLLCFIFSASDELKEPDSYIRINDNLLLLVKDGKHELVNNKGEYLLNNFYDHIIVLENESLIIADSGKWAFLETVSKNEPLFEYQYISTFKEGLAMVMQNNKWGYINGKGQIVIPVQFENAGYFSEGLAGVKDTTGKYGYINKYGETVIPFQYDYVWSFANSVARVIYKGKYGVINHNGKFVIEAEYDKIPDEYNGFFEVVKESKSGVITNKGVQLIPTRYDKIILKNDMFSVWQGKNYGLISTGGTILLPAKYEYIGDFINGKAIVIVNSLWGIVNCKGDEIVKPVYNSILLYQNGYAVVKLGNKYGIIDTLGNYRIPPKYDFIHSTENNDWIPLRGDYKKFPLPQNEIVVISGLDYGMIDKNGKEIIPLKYDDVEYFSEGLAMVEVDDQFGFIDETGKEVIPMRHGYATSFKNGRARIKIDNKFGVIDKTGKEIVSPFYDYIFSYNYGLAITKLNNKYGIINNEGTEIVKPEYDNIYNFNNGISITRKGDKYGFIVANPFKEIEPKYDEAYNKYGEDYNYVNNWQSVKMDRYQNFVDTTGKQVFPLKYTDIIPIQKGRFIVSVGSSKGLVEWDNVKKEWIEVIPVKNNYVTHLKDDIFLVRKGKYQIWNLATKKVIHTKYENINQFNSSDKRFLRTRIKKKYGVIDINNKQIIPPKYGNIHKNNADNFLVSAELNDSYGIVDTLGNEILAPVYDWWINEDVKHNKYIIRKNNKYGLASKEGIILIKPNYKDLEILDNNVIRVMDGDNLYCLADTTEKLITSRKYVSITKFDSMTFHVKKQEGNYDLIDYKGNEIASNCDFISKENGTTFVIDNKKYVCVNNTLFAAFNWETNKNEVSFGNQQKLTYNLSSVYTAYTWTKHGMSIIELNGKYGMIEPASGRLVLPLTYDYLSFQGDKVKAKLDDKYGEITLFGDNIIPIKYEQLYFKEDITAIYEEGYKLIKQNGKQLLPLVFEEIGMIKNGLIPVKLNTKWGVIDTSGNKVINEKYNYLSYLYDGLFKFSVNGKYGVIDIHENVIIEPEYEELGMSGKFVICTYGGKFGLLDRAGNTLVPPIYDKIIRKPEYGSDYLYITEFDGKFGIINNEGIETIRPKFKQIPNTFRRNSYSINLLSADNSLITEKGREIDISGSRNISVEKDEEAQQLFFILSKPDRDYIIDIAGKVTPIPENLLLTGNWKNNMCQIISKERKYGYINSRGKIIVPAIYGYDDIKYINENKYFEVKLNNKIGIIYYDGTVIAEPEYEKIVFPFIAGFAIMKSGDEYIYVDRYGKKYDTFSQLKKANRMEE